MKTPKMGRPPTPANKAKTVLIGAKFDPRENKAIVESVSESGLDKSKWLREAALEATQKWIKCDEWSPEDLQGKSVWFVISTILEGKIIGSGNFDVWKRGDGLVKIRILTHYRTSTQYSKDRLCLYVPQDHVKFIKKMPAGNRDDFSVIDPVVEKYVRAAA